MYRGSTSEPCTAHLRLASQMVARLGTRVRVHGGSVGPAWGGGAVCSLSRPLFRFVTVFLPFCRMTTDTSRQVMSGLSSSSLSSSTKLKSRGKMSRRERSSCGRPRQVPAPHGAAPCPGPRAPGPRAHAWGSGRPVRCWGTGPAEDVMYVV